MSISFRLLVAPRIRVTERCGIARALATAASAALVARPLSAGSTTRTTSAVSYSPPTSVDDAPGRTWISRRIGPVWPPATCPWSMTARWGASAPMERHVLQALYVRAATASGGSSRLWPLSPELWNCLPRRTPKSSLAGGHLFLLAERSMRGWIFLAIWLSGHQPKVVVESLGLYVQAAQEQRNGLPPV
jgi:hypothetical protein